MRTAKRDWPRIIEDQAASGKSVSGYCESLGIHPNTFYRMRRIEKHPAMVEVLPRASRETSAIVVNVGQYSVAIRSGFDAECLKAVLEVVAGLR